MLDPRDYTVAVPAQQSSNAHTATSFTRTALVVVVRLPGPVITEWAPTHGAAVVLCF
jgi:hypothetical protein